MTATVRLLCLFVVLAVCATAADPALLNLARRDVNFVMGINVSQIASSPRVVTALAEARRSKPEVEQLFQILGPNPLSHLEEIVVAGRLDPGQQNSEPENLLIAARGSFGGSAFTDLICLNGCESQEHREREILSFQAQNTGETAYVAFLDSQYAALGKLEDVRGAIDRSAMETESVFNSSLQTSIANLGHHHVWLAASGPFGDSLGGASGGMMPPGTVSKLEAVGFGLSLGRDVELAIEVDSHSPQDAKQLHDMVNGLLALMKAGDADADAKALLDSMPDATRILFISFPAYPRGPHREAARSEPSPGSAAIGPAGRGHNRRHQPFRFHEITRAGGSSPPLGRHSYLRAQRRARRNSHSPQVATRMSLQARPAAGSSARAYPLL